MEGGQAVMMLQSETCTCLEAGSLMMPGGLGRSHLEQYYIQQWPSYSKHLREYEKRNVSKRECILFFISSLFPTRVPVDALLFVCVIFTTYKLVVSDHCMPCPTVHCQPILTPRPSNIDVLSRHSASHTDAQVTIEHLYETNCAVN